MNGGAVALYNYNKRKLGLLAGTCHKTHNELIYTYGGSLIIPDELSHPLMPVVIENYAIDNLIKLMVQVINIIY